MKRKKMKKIQKKSVDQIFQKIENILMMQRDLIMLIHKLESEDIALHAVSSKAQAALKKFQN